jgi:hypothetical protein
LYRVISSSSFLDTNDRFGNAALAQHASNLAKEVLQQRIGILGRVGLGLSLGAMPMIICGRPLLEGRTRRPQPMGIIETGHRAPSGACSVNE